MRYTKLKSPLPRVERETSIHRCWGEDIWTVWSSDPAEIRRFERGGYRPVEVYESHVAFRVPRKAIGIWSEKAIASRRSPPAPSLKALASARAARRRRRPAPTRPQGAPHSESSQESGS